jgi:hypothetical protein
VTTDGVHLGRQAREFLIHRLARYYARAYGHEEEALDWFFDGLGTMLLGLVIGGGAGGAAGWKLGIRSTRQSQRAGRGSTQTQIGGDQVLGRNE